MTGLASPLTRSMVDRAKYGLVTLLQWVGVASDSLSLSRARSLSLCQRRRCLVGSVRAEAFFCTPPRGVAHGAELAATALSYVEYVCSVAAGPQRREGYGHITTC